MTTYRNCLYFCSLIYIYIYVCFFLIVCYLGGCFGFCKVGATFGLRPDWPLDVRGKLAAFALGVAARFPGDTLEPVLISGTAEMEPVSQAHQKSSANMRKHYRLVTNSRC